MITNLLQIIGTDTRLKRTSGTHGGEYHGGCPFCGGKDRFWVQPKFGETGRWRCRQCDRGGDAYRYLMEKRGMGFREAKALVDGEPLDDKPKKNVDLKRAPLEIIDQPSADTRAEQPRESEGAEWQTVVKQFVNACHAIGLENDGFQGWLAERGISAEVASDARLGASREKMAERGIDFYRGIVIPCFNGDGDLAYCKVRTGPGKYFHIKGGNGTAVYGLPDLPINPENGVGWTGDDVVIVETELDALMLKSVLTKAASGAPPA